MIKSPHQYQKYSHAGNTEPACLVPRRRDLEVQTCSLVIPDPVVIGGYHLKMVLAGTEPGIKGFAAGSRVLPVFIYSFQPVPKAYPFRNRQAQGRIANLEIGCSRGQDGISQGIKLSAIRFHRPYPHRRRKCIRGNAGGVDPDDAARRREPKSAVGSLELFFIWSKTHDCSLKAVEGIEDTILYAIGGIVQGLPDFRCGDLNYTAALSQPQAAVGCLLNSHNQTKRFGICRDDPSEAVPVEESQSRFSANP